MAVERVSTRVRATEEKPETEEKPVEQKPVAAGTINATPPEGATVRKKVEATWVEDAPPQKLESPESKLSQQDIERVRFQQHKANIRYTDLTEWLEFWRDAQGEYENNIAENPNLSYANVSKFKMVVTREADDSLMPGEVCPFSSPCASDRPLGEWPFIFEINHFIGQLQRVNNNSGGKFRVMLRDADGELILKAWFTNNGIPLPGQKNGIWQGQIPNPVGISQNQQKPREEKREKSRLDLLREMAEERKLQIELGIIKDDKDGDSLLSQLQSGVIPAFLGSVITTSTEVAKKALEASGGQDNVDRGAWGTLVHGVASNKELTDTLAQGVINGGGAVFNLLGDLFLEMRRDKQREREEKLRWERVEKWQAAHPNAPVPPELLDKPAESQPQGEDLLDVIMRLCESKIPGNFNHPEIQAAFNNTSLLERSAIKGALMNRTAEEVLNQFVSLAEKRGKGERAKKLVTLPQTIPFIKDMQRSLGKEVE